MRSKYCCICKKQFREFLPYREGSRRLLSYIHEADIIGSDLINFECPSCGCHDRERHLYMYLEATNLLHAMKGARILHFAPEVKLQGIIREQSPCHYLLADIRPLCSRIEQIDITNMDIPDSSFDYVIANHVLEHVDDDRRALCEILRVLKPGGWAILQTPFSAAYQHTYEDSSIKTDSQRLSAYGQEDHMRLYGYDFVHYIMSFGFISRVQYHSRILPTVDELSNGVNAREPFLLFMKPINSQ